MALLSTFVTPTVVESSPDAMPDTWHAIAERCRSNGVACLLERVTGDGESATLFPASDVVHVMHPPRSFNPSHAKRGLRTLERVLASLDASSATWQRVTNVDDLRALGGPPDARIGIVLGLSGSTVVEDDPSLLEIYSRLGVRVFGIVHEHANAAAGSYAVDASHGLTLLGERLVRTAAKNGMLIDVANLSRPALQDVLATVDLPLLASAGNPRALVDHPANLDEDVLRELAKRGGLIGISFQPERLSRDGRATTNLIADAIERLVECVGIDHVGVGFAIPDGPTYPWHVRDRLLGVAVDERVGDQRSQGIDTAAATLRMLARRGYDAAALEKLAMTNLQRVAAAVWPQDRTLRG